TPKNPAMGAEDDTPDTNLIRWSMQEIRRVATKMAQRQIQPASPEPPDTPKNPAMGAEDDTPDTNLIRWSMQEIRRVATKMAQRQIQPASIIAWSMWRRAHQAQARRAHIRKNTQL
ncbi:MAG: hypothetical protein KBA48_27975, partial [Niveispirillum sp.]|nr:hypothetical protein [Niveispirillum sp.]